MIFVAILFIAMVVFMIAAMWKVFQKAGFEGWECIVPVYNGIILCRIAGRPDWWVVLLLVPYVNYVFSIIVAIDVAKKFDKGAGFGVGLALLPFVFYPILGFGDATYLGNDKAESTDLIDQF